MKPLAGVLFLLIIAGLVGTLVGRSARPAATTTAAISRAIPEAETDAGMDRNVPAAKFNKLEFSQAIEQLRQATHANLVVKWRVLEAAGIDQNTPITLDLHDLSLRQVLLLMCDEVGAGTVALRARAQNGMIVVSTEDDFSRDVEVHIYDVRDLIIADQQFTAGESGNSSLFQRQQAATSPTQTMYSDDPYEASTDRLKQIIADAIAPDSWRDAGGTVGSIQDFNGLLIITQTPECHRQVADLLEKIRSRGK
jgi:hypothetical protein